MAVFPGPQIRCYFQAYDLLSDALYLINVADAAILFSNRAGLDDPADDNGRGAAAYGLQSAA